METGEELFRAAAWGQRPHTVDTSVPLPLWNKAQDSCPDACPPSAGGGGLTHHLAAALASSQATWLLGG